MARINILMRIVFIISIIISILLISTATDTNRKDILFLAIFSVSGFVLTIHLLYRTLIVPLEQLSRALDEGSSDPIDPLLKQKNRFSKIAALIDDSFKQKRSLIFQMDERIKAERALIRSKELYRSVVETSADAIIIIDHTGHVQFFNGTASVLFKMEEEVKHLHCLRFITSQELRIIRQQCNAAADKMIRNVECTLKRSDQQFFPAEISISAIKYADNDDDWYVVICKDISEQKIMEFEKNRMAEQLKVAHKMEAIGQLASGIAHDFNNVLGAISGYADIIRQRYSTDDKLNKYAQMIVSGSSRASELTNKLLTFSRRNKFHFSTVNIHDLLEDITDLLKHTVKKDIIIDYGLNSTNPNINGDVSQIQNIIMEIAVNAFHAMEEQGDHFLISTEDYYIDEFFSKEKAYAISPGQYIKISLKDNGIGMSKKTMARIFEPFFTTKSKGIGTGLGLATVYGSIKSHHGYIDVESRLNEGTTFNIYMPSIPTDAEKNSSPEPYTAEPMDKKRILIIDDEVFLCNALKEMLTWMGYTAQSFCDPFEAIDFLNQNPNEFDLIILDFMMPGLNGFEAYKMLKKINSGIKVIISSGYCLEADRQKLFRGGVNYILQKPFVSAQLTEALAKVFG